jgi:hypothetical protein
MLTLLGARQKFCDGISRRNFLKIGALGAGLSLADILRLRTNAGTPTGSSPKSVIMIYLPGGPSHIDMYDLKPEAPVEFRGEFKPIPTNVPGVQICELFPRQAKMWDKLACIRSVVAVPGDHIDYEVSTGYSEEVNRQEHHPSFGSVVSKLRGRRRDIPPFVSLGKLWQGMDPGYLGVAHRAFSPSGPGVDNLRLGNGMTLNRLEDRKQLLSSFDTVRREIDASGTMKGMDAFNARAFDMVASGAVHKAFDLSREELRTRERYQGVEQFLMARRLVEAGVGCVTLSYGWWDTHWENFKDLRALLPEVDRGIANLIQDLHDRGMERDVVTVMWGEMGRAPKIGDMTPRGRGHWPACMSALIAGGGLKMGQVVGASNARAEYPKDRPYRVSQVLSTLYQTIGIDPSRTFPSGSGRPMCILDDREPVTELM